VLVIGGQGGLQGAWPAKPLKPRRHRGVIQVRVVAATGAGELKHAGIARRRSAVPDADRLVPDECRPAVTGLPGKRGVMTPSGSMRSHGPRHRGLERGQTRGNGRCQPMWQGRLIFWAIIGGLGASLLLPTMRSLIHGNFKGAAQMRAYALGRVQTSQLQSAAWMRSGLSRA
jgi:hypothetical protein